ncbi:MAG: hypothetical protein Q9174_002337 [Haloplaca sp. 1 TL-2023]
MSTDLAPRHGFPTFIRLPLEIRCQIYEHLLLAPFNHHGSREEVVPFSHRRSRLDPPLGIKFGSWEREEDLEDHPLSFTTGLHSAILATCQPIHQEASPLFYGCNQFSLDLLHATYFPTMIGPRNANLLQFLDIHTTGLYEVPNQFRWDHAFRSCSNLRRLDIGFEFIISDGKFAPHPGTTTGSQYHGSLLIFFKRVQLLVKMHPTLRYATSSDSPAGEQRHHTHFSSLRVSLLAASELSSAQGRRDEGNLVVLDLDFILNDLREKLGKRVRKIRRPRICDTASNS